MHKYGINEGDTKFHSILKTSEDGVITFHIYKL